MLILINQLFFKILQPNFRINIQVRTKLFHKQKKTTKIIIMLLITMYTLFKKKIATKLGSQITNIMFVS